jgi:hypothetical protein
MAGLLGRVINPSQGRYLHTGQQKQNKRTHKHPCLEWDSNPRSQRSRERRQFMPYTVRSPWSYYTGIFPGGLRKLTIKACQISLSLGRDSKRISSECNTGALPIEPHMIMFSNPWASNRRALGSGTSVWARALYTFVEIGSYKPHWRSRTATWDLRSTILSSLTRSWTWTLLEKPPVVQLLKNFPAF